MTIELIDTEIEEENDSGGSAGSAVSHNTTVPSSAHSAIPPAVAEVERWSAYVEKYVSSVAPQVSMSLMFFELKVKFGKSIWFLWWEFQYRYLCYDTLVSFPRCLLPCRPSCPENQYFSHVIFDLGENWQLQDRPIRKSKSRFTFSWKNSRKHGFFNCDDDIQKTVDLVQSIYFQSCLTSMEWKRSFI